MKLQKLFFVFTLVAFLSACDSAGGDKYVGYWKRSAGGQLLEIKEQEGGVYAITMVVPGMFGPKKIVNTGRKKDGALQVQTMFGDFPYVLTKSGDLQHMGEEYKRISKEEAMAVLSPRQDAR